MAFVIQNDAVDALGDGGGGQGYQGIPNSLAVEFDTWDNIGDPGATHVAVHSLGTSPNSATSGHLGVAILESFRDGQSHAARVVYSPGRLHLFVDDMETPKLSVEVDLSTLLNLSGGAAFVGFTAATGAVTEGHHVERWRLCSAAQPTPPQDDGGTSQPPAAEARQELPEPEAGEEVNALPKSGTVRVKVAGTNRFVELEEGQQIPVGSVVDTTKGRVTIVAAGGQQADFFDGIFRLSQGKGAKPLTTLTLVEALSCPKAGRAVAAAKKKKKRRLWGDGSGKFRTEGKHSAATVVGTRWLVEDRCASTLTKVTRGKVRVRDFVKRKNVVVRAGKQYVARAKR
jgi:Legume lectin domain